MAMVLAEPPEDKRTVSVSLGFLYRPPEPRPRHCSFLPLAMRLVGCWAVRGCYTGAGQEEPEGGAEMKSVAHSSS